MTSRKKLLPNRALWHFGFRQTRKGAIVIGLVVAGMLAIQALGYNAAYPDEKARMQFAASMKEAPALGILYGEPDNLISATGYMVYRVVPFFGLIAAIWSLSTVTKLLRGQEEDGRWEQITAGATTARRASGYLFLGFITALLLAFVISSCITFVACRLAGIDLSIASSTLINAAILLPGVVFGALGIVTSQLSVSRRRSMMYGLIPLLIFFVLRAFGNTIESIHWLKYFTPFGWAELINPIARPELGWLAPFIITSVVLIPIALYFTGRRDLKDGLIKESNRATSHFYLLSSARAFAIRENFGSFIGWSVATIAVSAIIAAVSNVAAKSLADSEGFSDVVGRLGGTLDDLRVAFIGTGLVFTVVILLLMATQSMAAIRNTEAKNYIDNILTQPLRRGSWLISRLLIIIVTFTLISLLCGFATWFMARGQGIPIDFTNFLLLNISLTGTVLFTLGVGTLLYGILPRLSTLVMYCVIAWSFVIDIIGTVISLPDIIIRSSLLHYVSLSPNQPPDWQTFTWLVVLGVGMMTLGIIAFSKRDIISE